MRDHAGRYGSLAITLHWLLTVLVIGVGVLGLLHDTWPKNTQSFWINVHALAGLMLWVILLWRFGLRLKQSPPPLPTDFSAISRRLALIVHLLLYVLLFITPIIGIVTFIWHGRVLDLGFYQVHFGIPKDRAVFEPTEDVHGYLAYAIFALAAFHTLAALWHQFIRRDGVLQRMWWKT
jgi:cytochrome b561